MKNRQKILANLFTHATLFLDVIVKTPVANSPSKEMTMTTTPSLFRITITLAALLCLVEIDSSAAQNAGPSFNRGRPPGPPIHRLQEDLDLSDEQADTIMAIFEQAHEDCRNAGDSFEAHRNCMESQKENVDSQIASILTEEQQATFSELQQQRKNCQGNHPGRRDQAPNFQTNNPS